MTVSRVGDPKWLRRFSFFSLKSFREGDHVNRLLLADSGMAGVSSGRLAVVMPTPTIQPKPRSTFPFKYPPK